MTRLRLVLALGIIIAVALLGTGAWLIREDVRGMMFDDARKQFGIFQKRIEEFRQQQEQFVRTLEQHPDLTAYLDDGGDAERVRSLFLQTVRARRSIMQLRFIDMRGQEQFRVDRHPDETVTLTPQHALQNKYHRYYVRNFLALDADEVGYSPLDLNIEHGQIERPFNPTLRIGMPVYTDRGMQGVLVVNYYMRSWVKRMSDFVNGDLFLIDAEGYFMMHPDPAWSWSRYTEPPRRAREYFDMPIPRDPGSEGVRLGTQSVAFTIDLFGHPSVAVFRPRIAADTLVMHKMLEFGALVLLAFLAVGLPLIGMIRYYVRQLREEHRRSVEQADYLQAVLDNTFDALILIDDQANIRRVNRAALEMFGYREAELLGQNVKLLVPEPHHHLHDGYVANHRQNARTIIGRDRELFALRKNGSTLPISLAVSHMPHEGKHYFIGTIRDLSDLKAVEEDAKQKESMLIHQSKLAAMGEMINAIAHQWRQPLNSQALLVQDIISAYKYNEIDDDYFENFRTEMMSQLRFMSSTIDEFRNFFTQEKQAKECNLLDIVLEIRHLYWAQLKAHDITMQILCRREGAHEQPCSEETADRSAYLLATYPGDVKQLLLNLISNAKEAIEAVGGSDEAERTITVVLDTEGASLRAQVCDRAGGIPAETLERIFEPYFTTKEMGTGLGLFIAKSLAEKNLEGVLEYEHRLAEDGAVLGSCFILKLPRILVRGR